MTHALSATFFAGVGSYIYHLEQRQLELIQKRNHNLMENRKKMREYEESRAKERALA